MMITAPMLVSSPQRARERAASAPGAGLSPAGNKQGAEQRPATFQEALDRAWHAASHEASQQSPWSVYTR